MAQPKTLKGSKFLLQLGDGQATEVFSAPCAITTKSIDFSADTNDFAVPDCTSPDLPVWTERVVRAMSAGVTASGTLATDVLTIYRTWFTSATTKNIRLKVDALSADGGGYWAMAAVLTGFSVSGEIGGLTTVELTIASSGAVTWVPAV